MIKRLFPITAAALLLVGCSAPDQPAETSTVEATTSSSAASSATSSMTRVPSTTAEVPAAYELEVTTHLLEVYLDHLERKAA